MRIIKKLLNALKSIWWILLILLFSPSFVALCFSFYGTKTNKTIEDTLGIKQDMPNLSEQEVFPLSHDPYPQQSADGIQMLDSSIRPAAESPIAAEPIPADPGIILNYPQKNWRDIRYEIFQWEDFPSVIIFDTASYKVQDNLLKRLAFFTEKAGYRGRLATDQEIADLHGWNAHDYRAEDLAAFFETARRIQFPLLAEERELEQILLRSDIMYRNSLGEFIPGTGAIVSISRESPDYLRSRFLVHEGFHGLFFIDEDFRNFSRRRYENLSPTAKRFIISFFDYQHYDVKDQYLVINEFMAHILQQPVSQAAEYFGKTLASRIDASSWRRTVLPQKDEETGSWPELAAAFHAEAEAFSAYVNRRWGLAAGRIRRLK